MERTKKRSSHFGIGLLIYAILFLILSAVVLIYFYDWLGEYEASRPANAVAAYRAALAGKLPDGIEEAVSEVDRNLQDEAEIKTFLHSLLSRADIVRSATQSTDSVLTYLIRADRNTIGTLKLEQTGEQKLGFRTWSITGESYDLSAYYSTDSVTVPETYSVNCGNVKLDKRYITKTGIHYGILEPYYSELSSLPCLVTYTSGIRLGDTALSVYDSAGKAVPEEEMTEVHFLDNCSEEDRERYTLFTREFISNYVQFTANVNDSFYYYYTLLRHMVVRDSRLYERLGQSIESFGFTTTRSCDIIKDSVNLCSRLDKTHVLVDYTYTTETRSKEGDAEDTRNVRLLITTEDGDPLVLYMNNY